MRSSSQLISRFIAVLALTSLAILQACYPAAAAGESTGKTLIFLIDLSGSMRGEKIRVSQEALTSIVRDEDSVDRYALVGFKTSAEVILPPTTDPEVTIAAIAELRAGGYTALYDGIDQGLRIAESYGDSIIVTITDGNDTSSKLTIDEIASRVSGYQGQIYFISIGKNSYLTSSLERIAGDAEKVINVDEISRLLEELKPVIKSEKLALEVTKGSQQEIDLGYLNWFLLLVISSLFIFITIPYMYRNSRNRKSQINLLRAYDDEETRRRMMQENSIFYRAMRFKPFEQYVKNEEKRLLAAGLALDVRTWIYSQITIFVLLSLLLQLAGTSIIPSLVIAAFGGFGIGLVYLNLTRAKKSNAFAEELPDTLTIIASSLKSGLSFTQAMESVAREGDGEVSLQFRRVLAEVQVGRSLVDSLQDVAERMDSQDFRWTISALSIQREVGGNLSDILSTTAETIRGRSEIRREIKALSAEGRMSAYVLVALPILMALYLQLTKPEYIQIMLNQPVGIVMLIIVALLILFGWVWVKKVVEVDIT